MEPSTEPEVPSTPDASITFPDWDSDGFMGWVRSLPSIFVKIVVSPGEFFDQESNGTVNFAVFYGAAINTIVVGLSMLLTYFFNPGKVEQIASQSSSAFLNEYMWLFLIITWALMPLATVLILHIAGGILHLALRLFGWNKKPYGETIKIAGFTMTSQVASLVPYAGTILAMLWALVLEVLGLKKVHKLSTGKAIVSVILSVVLLLVGIIAVSVTVAFASNLVI